MLLTHLPTPLEWIIGGWQGNGIYTYRTGIPLQISNGVNQTNLGSPGQRPNNNGNSAKLSGPVKDRLNEYFDTSVFSQAGIFTFGNTSRTSPDLRAPFAAQHRLLDLQELLDSGARYAALPGRVLQRHEHAAMELAGNDGQRRIGFRRDHQRQRAAGLPDGVEADVLSGRWRRGGSLTSAFPYLKPHTRKIARAPW